MKRFALLSLTLVLCACHSNVRDSSPSVLKDGIQLQPKTVTVDAQHAKVVMKPSGGNYPVEFSISREGDPDPRLEKIGTALYVGKGRMGSLLSTLTQTVSSVSPQVEIQADPGKKLTVGSEWSDVRREYYYKCGMLKSTFTPERGRVYLVEVQFTKLKCEQQVYDITEPTQRVALAGTASEAESDY
ncbi:hypothetical protein [Pseudomonas costantinii]|uniref:Lipoprotein n=1 Tax=Pseudomonas costantinii TaxID=168469 RepID=A0A1S2UTU2_9PSED|nr:hypothetical protein [Pseudomonas costantinii]NVZ23182.1 hypothetical protein [Pseudomonas costantinii]OIN49833.1 hypothetical protein BFL40_20770 [Pseudomonas costantinii]SED76997.1 hypothetical protein SAMN04515675_2400 [Pseudomonas costantinii]